MPVTAPAHASMLTSLYPEGHGIASNWPDRPLRPACAVLPGIFRDRGYRTAAVVQAPTLRRELGLDRGFDLYLEPFRQNSRSDRVTDLCLDFIDREDKPFFIFLNYYDCHGPYNPPDEYARRFLDAAPAERERLERVRSGLVLEGVSPAADDVRKLEALYDGEIGWVDACLGALIEGLRKRGLLERTVVVLTADHGEGFEHDYFFDHGDRLYEPEIHVPLIVRAPGEKLPRGKRVSGTVSVLDLAPTCLELAGMEPPPEWRPEGRSLVPLARGEDGGLPRFSQVRYRKLAPQSRGGMLSVTSGSWKLVTPADTGKRLAPERGELYDLARDPGEENNLIREEPEQARRLLRLLRAWVDRFRAAAPGGSGGEEGELLRPDEETVKRLRALGYVF